MLILLEHSMMTEDKAEEDTKDSDQRDSSDNVRCSRVDEIKSSVVKAT